MKGLVSEVGNHSEQVRHTISADGKRVFFSTEGKPEHLFVRDTARAETLQLDVPAPGAAGGSAASRFQDASADGSVVFFTDEARLTADATASEKRADLYMCKIGEAAGRLACDLKDLTIDSNAGESADVLGDTLGTSEDGSIVYFVANGSLT